MITLVVDFHSPTTYLQSQKFLALVTTLKYFFQSVPEKYCRAPVGPLWPRLLIPVWVLFMFNHLRIIIVYLNSNRIWTRTVMSISKDDDHSATCCQCYTVDRETYQKCFNWVYFVFKKIYNTSFAYNSKIERIIRKNDPYSFTRSFLFIFSYTREDGLKQNVTCSYWFAREISQSKTRSGLRWYLLLIRVFQRDFELRFYLIWHDGLLPD